jgi:hypothetical protein
VAKGVEDRPSRPMAWGAGAVRDNIAAKFNVPLQERSVGKLPKKLNFSRLSVRPVPQSDLEAAFKNFAERTAIPLVAVEIWFQDPRWLEGAR